MAEPDRTNADAERVSDIVAKLRVTFSGSIKSVDPWIDQALADGKAAITIIEAQSKALAEARATAIEECAKIVDEFSPVREAFTTDDGGLKWHNPAQQMPIYNPEALAAAIRALTPTPENANG